MCPNCILNKADLGAGLWVAFGVCAIFFLVAVAGILWAFRNGEFEDMEDVKFDMMDDGDDGSKAAQAREAAEKARRSAKAQRT
jgi:nitrogen fixation-related uncharacterized protein